MKNNILYIIFLVVFLQACKKEEPLLPAENQPQFEIKGTLGGEDLAFTAGDENFELSVASQLLNAIPFYTGKISNQESSFELGVLQGNPDLESSLDHLINQVSTIPFAQKSMQPLFAISKDKFTNSSLIESIAWYVDGAYKATNILNIFEPGKYEICAHVSFNDGTQKTLCNSITLGYNQNGDFKTCYLMGSNSKLKAWISDSIGSIEKVEWYKDDLKVSESAFMEIPLQSSHKITAKVTFTNGVVKTRNFVMDAENTGKYIEDFTSTKANTATKWDYKAIINLSHKGENYSSIVESSSPKYIQINTVSFYGLSSTGKKVYKVVGNLSCDLKNLNTGEIIPLELELKFGIALD
jgi:hypothetical protein